MTPEDYGKRGDVNYFKTVESEVLQSYRDSTNDPILSVVAIEDQLECCKEIYRRCPSQLFCVNSNGNTILHHLTYYGGGLTRMLEYFLEIGAKAKTEDEMESGENTHFRNWVRLRNNNGETALFRGFQLRNYETTKLWIKADHDYKLDLLSMTNDDGDTPLHLAVKYQDLKLVELLVTEPAPEFEYSANDDGETPLFIAIRTASRETGRDNTSVKIRTLLLQKQPNQCKVRIGEKRWTSLHYAIQIGDVTLVKEIIRLYPDCVEVGDSEGRNFLHLAVKLEILELVQHVTETKEFDASILNQKDNYGNTPLHIAAEIGNESIAKCILYDPRVDKTTKNTKGQKALEIISFDYDKDKAGVYGIRDKMNEKELKDQSDFDLVVGALIATVSFTAGITVPGGYISEGPYSGMALLSKHTSFEAFVISNNFALVLSLYAVFSHFCTRRLLKREDIIYQLNVATLCTLGAIFAMMVAFITGSYAVLAISNRIAITVCANSCLFFIFAFRALLRMARQHKHHDSWNYKAFISSHHADRIVS